MRTIPFDSSSASRPEIPTCPMAEGLPTLFR